MEKAVIVIVKDPEGELKVYTPSPSGNYETVQVNMQGGQFAGGSGLLVHVTHTHADLATDYPDVFERIFDYKGNNS